MLIKHYFKDDEGLRFVSIPEKMLWSFKIEQTGQIQICHKFIIAYVPEIVVVLSYFILISSGLFSRELRHVSQ